jgi:hypothetical protein
MPGPDPQSEIDGMLTAAKPNGEDRTSGGIEIVPFRALLLPNLTTKGLVKGIIDAEALVLIYGEPGCGKTFLSLDLALCIAAGREWFGRRTRPGRVVYVAAEAGKSIRNRVAAWARERWQEEDEIDFRAVISPVDLCDLKKGDTARLAKAIGAGDVVIVDTVSRAMAGGDENSPKDMGAFVFCLDKLREYLGCAIIAIHHIGKDASRGARGHSLLRCAVDTEISVEKRDERVSVATVTKQRDMPAGAEIAFQLRQIALGVDQDGDPVTSCVVEVADYVPAAKPKELKGQAKEALAILRELVLEQSEVMPWGERAVPIGAWQEAMKQSGLFGEGAQFRNAWMRARGKLGDDGHVSFGDGYAWPTASTGELPF